MTERWYRGADRERLEGRGDAFDPVAEGERYRLAPEVSAEIWERVCREATGRDGRRDDLLARRTFHRVAAWVAQRGGRLRPDPGKLTRADVAGWGQGSAAPFAAPAPGKMTRVESEERWAASHLPGQAPGKATRVDVEERRAVSHGQSGVGGANLAGVDGAARGAGAHDASAGQAGGGAEAMWRQLFAGDSVAVGKLGRVQAPKGIYLKGKPAPHAAVVSPLVAFNAQVYVERRTPQVEMAQRWVFVVVAGGGGGGFIEERYLAIDPPEPTAKLHLVIGRETLGAIAAAEYGDKLSAGHDARLYVQALYEANKGRSGVRLAAIELSGAQRMLRGQAAQETLAIYRGVTVLAGHAIWIPGDRFVEQLRARGAITSGSTDLSKAWREAKDAASDAVEIVRFEAGVVVGILEGAYEAVRDLFKGAVDLVGMAFDIVKANVTGHLLDLAIDAARKLKDVIMHVPDLAKALGSYVAGRWTGAGMFGKGEFVGEVVGYVAANVLLALASGGGSLAAMLAEAAEAGSQLARAVMLLVKVADVAANPLKLLEGAGKGAAISEEAAAKLKQALAHQAGAAARKVEHGAEAAGKVEHGAEAAGKAERGAEAAGKAEHGAEAAGEVEHGSATARDVNDGGQAAGSAEHGGGNGGRRSGGRRNKPPMTAEAHSLDGLGHFSLEFMRDLSPTARGLVRKMEKQGWVRVNQIAKEDLVQISKWFDREVAVVQSPYGRLRLVLGTRRGILTESLKEGEVFVVHTHPIMRSSPRHFTKDLEMAGKNVEAVVDWNGQVTFYSKSGIMNPRGPDGILQPMRAYEAGFVDRDEKIIGFAKIDIIESAAGTVIKVVPR